jgi:multisubunit Na+/H+ antiporter MnhB subunit
MARLDPPPPRSPFLPPDAPPPQPPAEPRLQQNAFAGLILALLSLIAMLFIGNLNRGGGVAAVALAVAVVALLLLIPALRAAKRVGARRPRGAMGGLILGLAGAVFSGMALIGFTAFGTQIDQYASCMNAASTSTARTACQTQLENSIDNRLRVHR